ncbi:hypothetical protein Prudu_008651 [Prunus dulcis]|uniref:Uncharacterized protein n=1 Tax=Prunus dulcis TaxID=3755 RepID=A0A4Y1R4Q2_PRUDU|nr:hypothetical protein Prudu_008651 [Prunus dulcis]
MSWPLPFGKGVVCCDCEPGRVAVVLALRRSASLTRNYDFLGAYQIRSTIIAVRQGGWCLVYSSFGKGVLGSTRDLRGKMKGARGNFGWVQANCRKAKERAILLGTSQLRKSPGGTGSVKWGPISKEQEDEVEWVRAQLSETERECGNLVTQKNLLESDSFKEWRGQEGKKGAGKRPRDDDEGRVADVLGKRKALEEAHQHVMGSGPRLPPFDLQAPPKLPFGMEDIFAEGVEKVDFGRLRQQKKEVNLAMHRQEVPLINVFLEGVKSDPEALARTPASSFIDRAQKTILTSAYAFGEMYVSMAKADKEIQRLKRCDEMAKSKMAEAQEAIREKNALLLQKVALAKEVEELKRSKAEEVAAAQSRRSSPSEPQRS